MESISAFISNHLGEIGTSVAILCTYIDYRQSGDRYRTLFFLLTAMGALITMTIGIILDRENRKTQEIIDGFAIGGKDNYPLITVQFKDSLPEFYLNNISKDFSLFDIDCNYKEVSAKNYFIHDSWDPQSAGRFARISPGRSQELSTQLPDSKPSPKFPERRYNFFITCKNGNFHEQVVLRLIRDSLHCLVRVTRDDRIIYTTPNLHRYLFPGEKKIVFQHHLVGLNDEHPDPALEKAERNVDYKNP